ncbi:MAG: MerR family transcriptional regulator [Actinomycetales bacterium]
MMRISDLARHSGVSVRMLRHYDALGLVAPARVDRDTGYRWYTPSQLGRVTAVLGLRDLGLTLAQCRDVLDERATVEEFRDLLRGLEAGVGERLEADTRRLQDIRRRLGSLERGWAAAAGTFRLRELPALRLAAVRTTVNDTTEIPGVAPDLVGVLGDAFAAAGVAPAGPRIATYLDLPGRAGVEVTVGFDLSDADLSDADAAETGGGPAGYDGREAVLARAGLDLVEVPADLRGASVTYAGPLAGLADAWATVDGPATERGLRSHGTHRQVHLTAGDDGSCVVELQFPVRDAARCP